MSERIEEFRRGYHCRICDEVLRQNEAGADNDSDSDLLDTLVFGRRLRDISDLPFDLAI